MIVNWTKDNMKVIPAHIPSALDPSSNSRFCTLAPGYSEVSDEIWHDARTFIADDIASGAVVEEWKKVERPNEAKKEPYPVLWKDMDDGRAIQTILVPCTISDISRPGVIKRVIENTFHPATLAKWADEDTRPDVQVAILKQIKAVESGKIAG